MFLLNDGLKQITFRFLFCFLFIDVPLFSSLCLYLDLQSAPRHVGIDSVNSFSLPISFHNVDSHDKKQLFSYRWMDSLWVSTI